jgi:hypothetical protein
VKSFGVAVLFSLLIVASSHAKDRLIVGTQNWGDGTPSPITLAPNTANQRIPIYITPGASLPVDSHVGALDLTVQVGNGTSGPKLSGVDVLGSASDPTIFYGVNDPSNTWVDTPAVWPAWKAEVETLVLATPKTVNNNGVLAYLTVDTTGVSGSGPWSLLLDASSNFKTLLYGYPGGGSLTDLAPDIRNATISIAAVPEPGTWAMLLGLLSAMPAMLWFRARRRAA